jgi:hypothetical protein
MYVDFGMLLNVNTQILKYQYIYNIGVLKVNIELMWRGFRDPIHFSKGHPMTGASLGSYMSKSFSPITISSHNTERNHTHNKKQLNKYQLLELWKCGAGWQKVPPASHCVDIMS